MAPHSRVSQRRSSRAASSARPAARTGRPSCSRSLASARCVSASSAPGVVLAGTDFGGARRRLTTLFAALAAEITGRFSATLTLAGSEFVQAQEARRELMRRVIALDPVIDEAFGESSQLRYYSPVLQRAVDGLFAALAAWRTVAVRLAHLSDREARQEVDSVSQNLPQRLRSLPAQGEPADWIADPIGLQRVCEAATRRLIALPTGMPSLRLLADQTAEALAGISHVLNGLALLIADPAQPVVRRRRVRLSVPDWLPALVNAGRAFVTVVAVALFWIMTAWPNGANAITFAAIVVILFAPRADQAYAAAIGFMIGTSIAAILAAIIAFAVLPGLVTFEAFSIAIGLVLVPAGALMAQSWQTATFSAMAGLFIPLLAPLNQMSYDTQQFYNSASAIVAGVGAAVLSFRLLPPLSPMFRARRLLALSLRDLRRLATRPIPHNSDDWEDRMHSRFSALPDEAQPLQRSQLLTASSVGTAIIRLRQIARGLDIGPALDDALEALAQGQSADRDYAPCLARPDTRRAVRPRIWGSSGAQPDPCSIGGAKPTSFLLRHRNARVRFTEINLFGVFVAPMSLMMVAAWVVTIAPAVVRRPFRVVALCLAPFAVRVLRLCDRALVDRARRRTVSSPCRMLETKSKRETATGNPADVWSPEPAPRATTPAAPTDRSTADHPGRARARRRCSVGRRGTPIWARRGRATARCASMSSRWRRKSPGRSSSCRSPTISSCTRTTC